MVSESAGPSVVLPQTYVLIGAAGVLILVVVFYLLSRPKTSAPKQATKPTIVIGPKNVSFAKPDPEDDKDNKVTIFVGTQTGTAEVLAMALAEEGRTRYGGKVKFPTVSLDKYGEEDEEFEEKLKREKFAIFCVATYGDGEPTDDAATFYKWLAETLDEDKNHSLLTNLQYGVFGLGNTQYEHFCKVGKVVDEKLTLFGASRLVEVGLGDDDKIMEDDFEAWKQLLWPALDKIFVSNTGVPPTPSSAYSVAIPEYRVEIHEPGTRLHNKIYSASFRKSRGTFYDAENPCKCVVAVRRELHTPKSDRSCTHVEFDVTNTGLKYEAGDHLGVFAENHKAYVEEAAALLGHPLDLIFSIHTDDKMGNDLNTKGSKLPTAFPGPLTLESALSRYADLLSAPKKAVLTVLAFYASDPKEKERLKLLASPLGKEEYSEYVVKDKRTLLEVMSDFSSVKVPLGVFFAVVSPRLQPRFYSISSSPKLYPNRIHVTCALVLGSSATGKVFRGVSSTWMKYAESKEENPQRPSWAPIFIRTSTFRLPKNPTTPIVMIGPGTGLAPFRGFLQERQALRESGEPLGPAVLFFGCRTRQQDYIYEREISNFLNKGTLTDLHVAFSREGAHKEYVQHLMMQHALSLWENLSKGGYLYVCGDAKGMAKDVHSTLLTIIQDQESVHSSKAEYMVKQMQNEGRYQRDVW